MRRRGSIGLLAAACAIATVGEVRAQPKEAALEAPPMFYVMHEHIHPSMAEQYEEATRELIELLETNRIPPEQVRFHTVSGPEIGYTFVIPIKGFADMERAHRDWQAVEEKIGGKFKKAMARSEKAVAHRSSAFAMMRPDLSYRAEKPSVPPEEIEYVRYAFYYGIPGKEKDLEAVAREYVELYRKKNIGNSWTVYQVMTGDDLPLYVVAMPARSETEFVQQRDRNREAMAEEGGYLEKRAMETVRRIEIKEGWVRPDLSFNMEEGMAKEKKTEKTGRRYDRN